jgi:antitoxin (DNA-binding transcriptional repressor) of toxin-antitoxin stability system
MFNTVKTVTAREFYHTPALVRGLRSGEAITVTKAGKPDFIVTKTGQPPRKPLEQWKRERHSIKVKKGFSGLALLNDLRK